MKGARRKCTTATSGGSRRHSFSPSGICRIGAKLPAHLVADARATGVRTCSRGDDAADTSVADSDSTGQHLPCAWSKTKDATAEKKQPDMSDTDRRSVGGAQGRSQWRVKTSSSQKKAPRDAWEASTTARKVTNVSTDMAHQLKDLFPTVTLPACKIPAVCQSLAHAPQQQEPGSAQASCTIE